MKIKALFLSIVLLGSISMNAQFDYGQLTKESFKLDYLEMEIPIPENWWIRIDKQVSTRMEDGFRNASEINAAIARQELPELVGEAYLLMIQAYNPMLRIKRFNPTIYVMVENISKANPPLRDVGAYLYKARENLKQDTQIKYTFKNGFLPHNIGDIETYYMDAHGVQGTEEVNQRYLSWLKKEFVISLVLVYQDETQLKQLMAVVDQIKG